MMAKITTIICVRVLSLNANTITATKDKYANNVST